MDALRLGLIGLSSAEDALVATLFRLHRVDPSFIWQLATAPPFDALLVDAACHPSEFDHLLGMNTKLMKLGEIDSDRPDELPRPVRSHVLVRWLHSIEVEILHSSGDQFASTGIQSRHSMSWQDPETTHGGRLAPRPGPGPEAVSPARLTAGARFKLRRWPPHSYLNGDVNRVRMATMLSRRALSVRDLSASTLVPDSQCENFLRELLNAQLLDEVIPAPAAFKPAGPDADRSTPAAQTSMPEPKSRGIGQSLLRSIRKRFGI